MARKKGTKNKNIDRCKFSVYCIVKFLEENTIQHECKIIGYTQITNDPEQEVSILYDTKKKCGASGCGGQTSTAGLYLFPA